jgi:hypothetical protein
MGRTTRSLGASYVAPETLDETLNRCGRTRAMTVFTPIRPWYRPPGGTLWVRVVFWFARRSLRKGSGDIGRLSFIHFARWGIVGRIPDLGQPPEQLRQPLFMFESNYNGTFNQYIDSFANILTRGMQLFWGSSYGFPKPKPVARFIEYIHANEFIAQHYYSAYPTATTTMIVSALALEKAHDEFRRVAPSLSPEDFAAAYEQFLTDEQAKL